MQSPFPKKAQIDTETPDLFHQRLFIPLFGQFGGIFGKLRWIQHGALQFYVLYIALTLVGLLVWELY